MARRTEDRCCRSGAFLLLAALVIAESNRSSRQIICQNWEYNHMGFCCEKCPAGKYVRQHCQVQQGKGHCEPCRNGEEFTEYDNGLDRCLSCKRCRPDEDITSICTSTHNTRCHCKPGSFCLPDQVCEHCEKCTDGCPEGEAIVQKCNATANIECGGKSNRSGEFSTVIYLIAAVSMIIVLAAAAAAVVVQYYKQKKTTSLGNANQFGERELTTASEHSLDRPLLENVPNTCVMVNEPSAPIANNITSGERPPVQEINEHFATSHTDVPPRTVTSSATASAGHLGANNANEESYQKSESSHQEKHSDIPVDLPEDEQHNRGLAEHNLIENMGIAEVPADASIVLYTFINEVPVKEWRRFMRTMRLKENDIEAAIQDNPRNIKEQHYQMLCTWCNTLGNEASINKLLEGLCEMGLKGCSENIQNNLIKCIYSNNMQPRDKD